MGIPDPLTWLLRNLYAGQEYEKITLQILLKAENDKEKLQLIEVVLPDSNFQLTKSFIVKGFKKKKKKKERENEGMGNIQIDHEAKHFWNKEKLKHSNWKTVWHAKAWEVRKETKSQHTITKCNNCMGKREKY